jgi:tripartite-type tricarboxylate transporter receptor subunit TctC
MRFRHAADGLVGGAMAAIASCLVAPVLAQTPGRTVTIAVPILRGSGPDILARLIGDVVKEAGITAD